MSVTQFTAKDYEVIAREYAPLREEARRRCASDEELKVVQQAFEFANEAHKNVRRRSGEPYILHPIAVARIVVENIGLGYKSITAALLHDVVEDTHYTVDDIRQLFGDKIATLVDGLTKIKNVLDDRERKARAQEEPETEMSLQAENFKRILLTMNDDVRVVLIKLADRLHNCRTIEYMPEYKRDKILSETMFIFIPLAHRLGLYEVKSEMENIWLRFKEPDAFHDISERINRDSSDKGREIDRFIRPIEEALDKAGFSFHVKKRVKTPYSIWNKMKTKNISFDQVYDLYAVRIIFTPSATSNETERDQCYHIFSIITGIYRYKPDRVRDWVKHPKSNGYEALHCTLVDPRGMWVEVQIRSRRMDDIAEKGIAAHWAYKKDGYISEGQSEMDKWLDKVKEIIVSPDVNALDLLDIIHKDLTTSDIIVFTPRGEQRSVPKGATALDFAYSIHSHIGSKAIAAKANLRLVPLSYELKSGDTIEIITLQSQTPQKEWLSFVRTRHARNLIMDYFKSNRPAYVESGRKALEGRLSQMNVNLGEAFLREASSAIDLQNGDDLCFRYALGLVSFEEIVSGVDMDKFKTSRGGLFNYFRIGRKEEAPKTSGTTIALQSDKEAGAPCAPPTELGKKFDRTNFVINSPAEPYKYHIRTCCNPIPGDPVVGFFTSDGGIEVHKKTCPEAEKISSKRGDWIILPRWSESTEESFPVKIVMRGIDRVGLLNDITRYISVVVGANMRKLQLGTSEGIFDGYIELMVRDKEILEDLLSKLRSVPGIQEVERSEAIEQGE